MHKRFKIAIFLTCLIVVNLLTYFSVFATTDSSSITETIFFGNVKDDGSGCGVYTILNAVVDIMTTGIGILAVIGIAITGTKYLTAGGNEEQTRKARQRMSQIIIGVAAYVLLYAGVQFLLPGGHFDSSSSCATVSDQELAKIKQKEAEEAKAKQTASKTSSPTDSSKTSSSNEGSGNAKINATCLKKAIDIVKSADICQAQPASERIARTAELLAWPNKTDPKIYRSRPTAAFKKAIDETMTFPKDQLRYEWTKGRSCCVFATAAVRASGYDRNFGKNSVADINNYAKKSKKWQKVSPSKAVRGDVFARKDNGHVMIYGGKKGSKYIWYQADHGDYYGYTQYTSNKNPASKTNFYVWHAIGD